MGWNPRKWGAHATPGLDAVTPQAVVAAATQRHPEFICGAAHPFSEEDQWNYTFYAYYRVTVNRWRISLAVHQHLYWQRWDEDEGGPVDLGSTETARGKMFIPGYAHWDHHSDRALLRHFPPYDPVRHRDGWCNHPRAARDRMDGRNRYPKPSA
jgi:hypothetical protein